MKFFECIGKGGRDVSSGFAVQPLYLHYPGTSGRTPERASKVPSGLGMVVRTLATGSVASCDCQPSEPSVIHDLVRLRLHQIVPVAPISVRIDRPPRDARGPTKGGEAGGGSSCGGEFSPGGGSTQ